MPLTPADRPTSPDSRPLLPTRRLLQLLWLVGLLALLTLTPVPRLKLVDTVENATLSLRFALRGVESPRVNEPRIVLVTVDDLTLDPELSAEDLEAEPWLAYFEEGWPWNRALHGELLQRLMAAGARAVSFDFLFLGSNEGDWDFYEALEESAGKVSLAFSFAPVRVDGEIHFRKNLPSDDLLPEDESDMDWMGFVNVELDDDGVVREAVLFSDRAIQAMPLATSSEQRERLRLLSSRLEPRMALATRAVHQYSPEALARFSGAEPGIRYPINYAGPSGWFPTVRAIDLFLEDRRERVAPRIEGSLAIVVPWSDAFKDIYPTPMGNVFGGEIHAHIARNILLDRFLARPGAAGTLLWLGGFVLAVFGGVCLPRSALFRVGSVVVLPLLALAIAQAAFSLAGVVLPMVPALGIVIIGGGMIVGADLRAEQRERKRIRSYLNRYVSREVAGVLLERGDGFASLNRGENRKVSLLFSDIRGFTAMSEGRSPAGLTAQLNEYFEHMGDAVFLHRGSLNKYIGDALFAVWGDLYSNGPGEDASQALKAALAMREGLERLNREWISSETRTPLRIGIGLHSGEAFVGNLGHPDRLEVAVLGSAVNVASRIEGATKDYGVDILVSGAFRDLLPDHPFAMIDRVRLAGVSEPTDLFYPAPADSDPWIDKWNRAVEHFRQREFEMAERAFTELDESPEKPREFYLAHCRQFQKDPPPLHWNFVNERTVK